MVYPAIVGRIAEHPKKKRKSPVLKISKFCAKLNGIKENKFHTPNIMHTYIDLCDSYLPNLFDNTPPIKLPKAGPVIEIVL